VPSENYATTRRPLATVSVILLAGIVCALLATVALKACPYSGDEYSTLLQAEGFARGVLKAPAPPYADWVQVDHVVIDDYVRSKYPPGEAALLALGVLARVPWLVNPLAGMLALIFVWLTARLVLDEGRAFLAVCFVAATPLFLYESASYFSHVGALLFGASASYCVALWGRSQRGLLLVPFGVSVGCLFLMRPMDALLLGASLLAFKDVKALVVSGAAALPFVGLQLRFNKLQFGSMFTDGYAAYKSSFVAAYGVSGAASNFSPWNVVSPEQIFTHLAVVETFVAEWTVPGTALLALIGYFALRRQRVDGDRRSAHVRRFFGFMSVLYLGALLFMFVQPDDGPKPRYLTMELLPLSFFAAAGWPTASAWVREQVGRRMTRVVGVVMWIAPIFLITTYLENRVPQVVVQAGLEEALSKAQVASGVVIVRAEWPTRYARNGMFFDRRPLLLSVSRNVTTSAVAARFPGEAVYEAFEPHGSNPWKHPWVITRVFPADRPAEDR
jgi:4-amino-4-deoxy-L-arabinose transferase-like glycosyltransferase